MNIEDRIQTALNRFKPDENIFFDDFQSKIKRSLEYSHITEPSTKSRKQESGETSGQLVVHAKPNLALTKSANNTFSFKFEQEQNQLVHIKKQVNRVAPTWHAPWKLQRVISGHIGPVRCLSVDVSNEWFATGSGDRIIKIWDLASGTLKLSLTGHISAVKGVAVSPRHPYLFSCGEDKTVKCWDLEQNKVIRSYHGHLSAVNSVTVHPTLDLLITTGRDSTARVWDMRTKAHVFALTGHQGTVYQALANEVDPQVITGGTDGTIRLYDLAAGKTLQVLTHHKKAVRALAKNPNEFAFSSASADNIKQWKLPEGSFLQNVDRHPAIINTLCINQDNVMFSGGDNGTMNFYDYKSGHCFQTHKTIPQPGSLDAEAGIYCAAFDRTGTRLITGEADKSIKVWKMDENATEETHPMNWRG